MNQTKRTMNTSSLSDSSSVGSSSSSELQHPPLEDWLYRFGSETEDEKENEAKDSNQSETIKKELINSTLHKKKGTGEKDKKTAAAKLRKSDFKNLSKRLFKPKKVKKKIHYEHISLIHGSENPSNDNSW